MSEARQDILDLLADNAAKDAEIEHLQAMVEAARGVPEIALTEMQGHAPTDIYEDGYADACANIKMRLVALAALDRPANGEGEGGPSQSLIETLRKAKEGSRELDGEIAYAVGWCRTPEQRIDEMRKSLGREPSDKAKAVMSGVPTSFPPYSRSLDAALTLVPEDMLWVIRRLSTQYSAILKVGTDGAIGLAPSAPLALVIAALTARLSTEAKEGAATSVSLTNKKEDAP